MALDGEHRDGPLGRHRDRLQGGRPSEHRSVLHGGSLPARPPGHRSGGRTDHAARDSDRILRAL